MKTVLVTGMGGNVGQGIARNVAACGRGLRIVGTNNQGFSGGNHLCDAFYVVPNGDRPEYIESLNRIIAAEQVDLLLPSTDIEADALARHREALACAAAVSGPQATGLYLDKWLSFQHHRRHGIPWAETVLPSGYRGQFPRALAKPRCGRGSRGLLPDPDASVLSDQEYLVQELHQGVEITAAAYVTRSRQLLGHITLVRTLDHGATQNCRVTFEYADRVPPILEQVVATTDVLGSFNLQAMVTPEGAVVPFEVNCRLSGTNSVRAQFGFQDVLYTLQEHLFGEAPEPPSVRPGCATRLLLDVIYPDQTDFPEGSARSVPHYVF